MEKLMEMIEEKGEILNGNVLKVDSFLNHAIDIDMTEAMAKEFANHFKESGITKIITVESGGIPAGYATARLLNVPMVFVKKTKPSTMKNPITSKVFSYTKQTSYTICVEKHTLSNADRILFIDDFLANGEAFKGVEDLVNQSGAKLIGAGICIDKTYQKGHDYILEKGYDLYSLAPISSLENGKITWKK